MLCITYKVHCTFKARVDSDAMINMARFLRKVDRLEAGSRKALIAGYVLGGTAVIC